MRCLLAEGLVTEDVAIGPIVVSLGAYARTLYDEWLALGTAEVMYAAFRLSGTDDLGCATACDSGCSIKRAEVGFANTSFTMTLSDALVDIATGLVASAHQSEQVNAVCAADGSISLTYAADTNGNTLPDFSAVGYRGGASPPSVAAVVELAPRGDGGDDGAAIQAALDEVAALELDGDGRRGAVLLGAGEFFVNATLVMSASGVVLRGAGEDSTTVWATREEEGFVLVEVRPTRHSRMAEGILSEAPGC